MSQAKPAPLPTAAPVTRLRQPLTFSIILEWDNAKLSELGRALRALRILGEQIAALHPARFELRQMVVAFDRHTLEAEQIRSIVAPALGAAVAPQQLVMLATDGLVYYQLKNAGARRCDGEILLFADSDSVPEEDWLRKILSSFRDRRVRVVCGSTYIEPSTLVGRSMALWWFFPLRQERAGLRKCRSFFANNFAIRRRLFFRAGGFPESPTFRGQCVQLGNRLQSGGVVLLQRDDARVAHPPPNGWYHFISRSLCEGHDLAMAKPPTWGESWRRLVEIVRYSRNRVARGRARVGLGTWGGRFAILHATTYYTIRFVGERLALRRPQWIRKYFPV